METNERARDRYSRQVMFPGIDEEGQDKLSRSSVIVIGCGALGCQISNLLVRAGVRKVRIVDRDFVVYHNLHRQTLFDEDDIRERLPKAIAAKRHLDRINSLVEIEGIVADVNFSNVENLCSGMDVIVDGLDNIETRFLVNDVSMKLNIPYIYGGAISSIGMTMTSIPGQTPCFRCVFPQPPDPHTLPTCETAGVLGPMPAVIGSLEATEALKILVGAKEINKHLIVFDIWDIVFDRQQITRNPQCPACNGRYEFLDRKEILLKSSLCGQSSAIQIVNTEAKGVTFTELVQRLKGVNNLIYNDYMLQFDVDNHSVIVFPDGRAIIGNTLDESLAEKIYVKYVMA